MTSLAGAAVALIILVDLATGQGPPALQGFLGPPVPPPEYRQAIPVQSIGYMPRGEYEIKRNDDKEYEKSEKLNLSPSSNHDKGYENDYEKNKSTPAPGVLASFSNSMSDAWKSFTNLGRSARSTRSIDDVTIDIERPESKSRSSGRSLDDWEYRQMNNNGYIFFKVPRSLVCYS